jgi:hypothetical protein
MLTEGQARDGISALVSRLDEMGWTVRFSSTEHDAAYFQSKEICIRNTVTLEHQLYTLCHELGHVLIGVKDDEVEPTIKKRRTVRFRVDTVVCEVRAWDLGAQYARVLGVKIDENEYAKYSSRFLIQWFAWSQVVI